MSTPNRRVKLRAGRPVLPLSNLPASVQVDEDSLQIVHKFGRNTAVSTTVVPVTVSGVYRTPTTATSLEVVSSDADDNVNGAGARTFTIQGLGADWTEVTQTVNMNGTTAVAIPTALTRVYRFHVASVGTYQSAGVGAHQGTITVREAGAGQTWGILDLLGAGNFGAGQSLVGVYTIPSGKIGYISDLHMSVDGTKSANFYLFQRPNADTVAAPFSPIRLIENYDGIKGVAEHNPRGLIGPYIGPCDIGVMANVAQTAASCSASFEIFLFDIKN